MSNNMNCPGCVRLLGLSVILFASLQLSAALTMLRSPAELQTVVPIWVLASLAFVWAALFATAGVFLLRRQSHAVHFSAWVVLAYIVIDTGRFVLFAQSDYERGRMGFRIVTAALIALIPTLYLVLHSRGRANPDGEDNHDSQ